MIARKFHSFSISIISYMSIRRHFEKVYRSCTYILSLGAGFRGGTIKVIVLYTYMIWEGGRYYTGSSCTLYTGTYMVWGLELSVGRPLECWWLKTKFKMFHNCCSFLNFKNPFNYINRYIYHKFQLILLKLTVYCAKFCDRVSF